MARTLAIALVALAATAASSSAAPLLQDALDAGWESRWTHSSDAKYTGRFQSADKGAGVQVRDGGRGGREGKERKRKGASKKGHRSERAGTLSMRSVLSTRAEKTEGRPV
jgi:hypothetical protein